MKIVIVTPRFPYPIEKGDKLRIYHQIRLLSRDHTLHLLALSDERVDQESMDHIRQFVDSVHIFRLYKVTIILSIFLRFFSGLPLQVLYFYNKRIKSRIHKMIADLQPDVIYNQLIRTTEYTRELDAFKVLDYMDAFSAGMHQRLDNCSLPFRWIYTLERDRLIRYEEAIFEDFDRHSIISAQDRERIVKGSGKKLFIVPNGVDTDYFRSSNKAKKYDICFVGNMGYRPNIIASEYLCREVLPKLLELRPTLKLLLAGARPHARVKALMSANVHVSGWLEDIRSAYDESLIFVAPIFTGIGQQNKVLEAMSMKMPCICTTPVNNPIGAKDEKEVLVADSAEDFVERILSLLDDQEKIERLGTAGRKLVEDKYSWDYQVNNLQEILTKKND